MSELQTTGFNSLQQQLHDEAAERLEAFYNELLAWADIVTWADIWILKLPTSPDELIEISLSQSRLRDGIDALSELSRQSQGETVLPFLKALWRTKYLSGQMDTLTLTERIWNLRGAYVPWDSEEYLQIWVLEHLMEEARGAYLLTDSQKRESFQRLEQELLRWLSD